MDARLIAARRAAAVQARSKMRQAATKFEAAYDEAKAFEEDKAADGLQGYQIIAALVDNFDYEQAGRKYKSARETARMWALLAIAEETGLPPG